MKEIIVAIAGANEDKIFELVDNFKNSNIIFNLFGVGSVNHKFSNNVNYCQTNNDEESVKLAVQNVVDGADILFKGLVQTHTLLKEVLKKENNLRQQKVLSHVASIELPESNRKILLSDAAMNIAPDVETTAAIIDNAIFIAEATGMTQSKVAILSSAENYNEKMPSSVLGTKVSELFKNRNSNHLVYGPISFDIAMSKEIAEEKKFDGPIQGDADILIVPTIDVGNVLYKSLTLFAHANVGGIIVGAKIPIVITSRGDSLESKIQSLKFALNVVQGR